MSQNSIQPNITGLEFYRDAFFELSTCRSNGPIPFTAIAEYCRIFNVANTVEELDEFIYVIRCMDDSFLRKEKEKAKKGTQQNGGTNSNSTNNSQSGRKR